MKFHNQYLLALSLTKGIGPVTVKNLIAYCGSPEAVFSASKGKLMRTPGLGNEIVGRLQSVVHLERAEKELNFCTKHNIEILTYLDDAYPQSLKYIHNAPLVLFKKGKINLNAQPAIAIVGTRKATDYGQWMAEKFAQFFAEKRINVVSGMAYGVDIAAHRAVLKKAGKTTAVLAHGLDTLYPGSHAQKAREMLEAGGWVTEYFTGTKPEAPHFPARNRIIAGMSRAVVVVEASEKGGALITARNAFEQNREVYAIPGRVGDRYSVGCNALIRDQVAKLVVDPQEVLEDLDIQWQHHDDQTEQLQMILAPLPDHLSASELKVLNLLSKGERIVDDIAHHTGIPMAQLSPLLLTLEFKEMLRQLPGKKFRRIR